jgi:hypothetical protein
MLRVHNSAGIPIIEGHCMIEAGQRQVVFEALRPLGIEAYAHKSAAEQQAVARRIWGRRAYGVLSASESDHV